MLFCVGGEGVLLLRALDLRACSSSFLKTEDAQPWAAPPSLPPSLRPSAPGCGQQQATVCVPVAGLVRQTDEERRLWTEAFA